jgi:hypothetical protein
MGTLDKVVPRVPSFWMHYVALERGSGIASMLMTMLAELGALGFLQGLTAAMFVAFFLGLMVGVGVGGFLASGIDRDEWSDHSAPDVDRAVLLAHMLDDRRSPREHTWMNLVDDADSIGRQA